MLPRIVIFADWYLPGYKAGGLVTALSNLVDAIGEEFELHVITRDCDLTDEHPYSSIRRGEWQTVGRAQVLYTADFSFAHLRRQIKTLNPDIVYLNSFFSPIVVKVLCLRKLGWIPAGAFVLAPRGELSPGALKIKPGKKSIFMRAAISLALYEEVLWHASSDLERSDIEKVLQQANRATSRIVVAWDMPNQDWRMTSVSRTPPTKRSGSARFIFLSRISPKKGLLFALDEISQLKESAVFEIYGPIDHRAYWRECEKRIQAMPSNVSVSYKGSIPRAQASDTLANYDFFILPTAGENFGYAILESLAAGCPVLVSDQTPWLDLGSKNAGWVLPLTDRDLWRRAFRDCVAMSKEAYRARSASARHYVESWAAQASRSRDTSAMFISAMEGQSARQVKNSQDPVTPISNLHK